MDDVASQIDLLEETYQVERYPSPALRAEVGEKLGLSDRKIQMWFCHRRLKDSKLQSIARKGGGAASSYVVVTHSDAPSTTGEHGSDTMIQSLIRGFRNLF